MNHIITQLPDKSVNDLINKSVQPTSDINIWDRFCLSFPSLSFFTKPCVIKEYGKRIVLFQKDEITFQLIVVLYPCMEGKRNVPCCYYLSVEDDDILEEKNGDLMDSSFVVVIYEILEKYFSPSK